MSELDISIVSVMLWDRFNRGDDLSTDELMKLRNEAAYRVYFDDGCKCKAHVFYRAAERALVEVLNGRLRERGVEIREATLVR